MSTGTARPVSEALPNEAWNLLGTDDSAVLVDVRTEAEWNFVGVPDLRRLGLSAHFVEWSGFPGMSINPQFAETVLEKLGPDLPGKILFLCRSGVRSMSAARAVAGLLAERGLSAECINIAEGFEGDLDAEGHRGRLNGWKFRGLDWRQS